MSDVEDRQRLLEERAKALAALPPREIRARNAPRYLLFSVSGEKLALPLVAVRAFMGEPDVVPLPDAPPAIRGIVLFEGRVITVVAVEILLGHPARAESARSLVLLGQREPEVAVAIEAEEGISDLAEVGSRATSRPGDIVVFTLPDGRSVIDPDALVRDPRGMIPARDHAGQDRRIEG